MIFLTADTSDKACSVGIYDYSDGILKQIGSKRSIETRTHSEVFLPLLRDLLNESNVTLNDIDLIASTVGPGSFTGIRIGIATVKGLAASSKIPTFPISSMRALAFSCPLFEELQSADEVYEAMKSVTIVPSIDARNERVFATVVTSDKTDITEGAYFAKDLAPKLELVEDMLLVGSGSSVLNRFLTRDERMMEDVFISPHGVAIETLLLLNKEVQPIPQEELSPRYFAVTSAERMKSQNGK